MKKNETVANMYVIAGLTLHEPRATSHNETAPANKFVWYLDIANGLGDNSIEAADCEVEAGAAVWQCSLDARLPPMMETLRDRQFSAGPNGNPGNRDRALHCQGTMHPSKLEPDFIQRAVERIETADGLDAGARNSIAGKFSMNTRAIVSAGEVSVCNPKMFGNFFAAGIH